VIKDEQGSRKFYGIYRGIVQSNKDPLNKNRVKVTVPQVFSDSVTEWCWPVNTTGFSLPKPAVGQGVWVMFEGGDPSFPIWAGLFGKFSSEGSPLVVTKSPPISGQLTSGVGTDGVSGLDLVATLVAMSNKISELEGEISSLESRVSALE
jgi:hypothetical protein